MTGPVDLAVVGNGRVAALVNNQGALVWWCFPRFDSDPVFCRLISGDEEKGFCDVLLDRVVQTSSYYERNTATVITILTADDGAQVKITDFAPRLRNYDRLLRPPQPSSTIRNGSSRETIVVSIQGLRSGPLARNRAPAPIPTGSIRSRWKPVRKWSVKEGRLARSASAAKASSRGTSISISVLIGPIGARILWVGGAPRPL